MRRTDLPVVCRLFALLVPLALATALAPPASASRVRPVNLEEMTARAGRIVAGECVAVEVVRDDELGLDVARVTLRVDQSLKGVPDETVTLSMLAGAAQADPRSGVAGIPRFAPGEKLILFLYGESGSGLTSPVGLGQGKFVVVEDKDGREVALNGFGNRMLFQNLSADARTRLGDAALQWEERDGIPASLLLEMVQSLATPE
jgi:hypothetical protein